MGVLSYASQERADIAPQTLSNKAVPYESVCTSNEWCER